MSSLPAPPTKPLTLADYLALPEVETSYELMEGRAVPKMSPKRFHSKTQKAFLYLLDRWCGQKGEVELEWAVTLTRHGQDWVPIPDLLYISSERLPPSWQEDAPCPVPPELVIEIISPEQPFGWMAEKATDYLVAGVLRAWVVDPRSRITVFYADRPPRTFTGTNRLEEDVLPGLQVNPEELFVQAELTT